MAASSQTPPTRDETAASRRSFPRWFRTVGWRHLVGLVGALFALFPVVWMVSASINPTDTPSGSQLIPDGATLANYKAIFENPAESPFMTWLWSSYYISFIVATFCLRIAMIRVSRS